MGGERLSTTFQLATFQKKVDLPWRRPHIANLSDKRPASCLHGPHPKYVRRGIHLIPWGGGCEPRSGSHVGRAIQWRGDPFMEDPHTYEPHCLLGTLVFFANNLQNPSTCGTFSHRCECSEKSRTTCDRTDNPSEKGISIQNI